MTTKKTKKGEVKFDYTTIKSFTDSCKKEGIDPASLPEVSMIPEAFRKAIIAAYKLFIIYKAINNSWTPDWSNFNQAKYYPWFAYSRSSGFGFSNTSYDFTRTATHIGSRLCTDTSDKAMYIASTFQEEYKDFLLILE